MRHDREAAGYDISQLLRKTNAEDEPGVELDANKRQAIGKARVQGVRRDDLRRT